jgi:hypothetical protein
MNTKRVYFSMIGLTIILLIGVVAAMFGALKILRVHSDGLTNVKLENRVLDNQQASLQKAKAAITKYSELNDIAKTVVPKDKDQARTVRDISTIASELNIKLSSITFPASTLGQSTKTNSKETQVTPVKGMKGVYQLQITVQQDKDIPISYATFLKFLERLESNRRTAQVTNITITPSDTSPNNLTFSLTLGTYIKP